MIGGIKRQCAPTHNYIGNYNLSKYIMHGDIYVAIQYIASYTMIYYTLSHLQNHATIYLW